MEISSSTRTVIIVVFAIYTIILMGYGIYSRKFMKKTAADDFFEKFATGGKSAGAFVTAMTVCAGIAGAGVFLGVPGYIVTFGSVWLVCSFWSMSCTMTSLGLLGKKTGIVGRRINAQTFVELLMHRFENSRIFAAIAALIVLIFLGVFAVSTITGGGRIFQVLTGLDYRIGLVIFTVLVIIAAVSGGFKGVTTTIMIQGIVMTLSVIVLFIFGIGSAGPIGEAVRSIHTIDPEWWGLKLPIPTIISFCFLWGFACFNLPHVCMGSLSYQSTQTMHRAIKIGIICYTVWLIGLNLLAIPAKATFADSLASADLTTPTMAVSVCPPWVAGLILAGVCAAVQSSIGGMILTLSTCFTRDLFQHAFCPNAKADTIRKMSLGSTILIAIIVCAFAWNPPALLAALITYGTGGLAAAFTFQMLLAFYWKGFNKYGATVSMIAGIIFYVAMDKGFMAGAALGMNPCIMGGVYASIIGIVISLVTPKTKYGVIQVWFGEDYPDEYATCETK